MSASSLLVALGGAGSFTRVPSGVWSRTKQQVGRGWSKREELWDS